MLILNALKVASACSDKVPLLDVLLLTFVFVFHFEFTFDLGPSPAAKPAPPVTEPKVDMAKITKKIDSTIAEYLQIYDVKVMGGFCGHK